MTAIFRLELTDNRERLREKAHGFAREVIRPAASEYDRTQELPEADEPLLHQPSGPLLGG